MATQLDEARARIDSELEVISDGKESTCTCLNNEVALSCVNNHDMAERGPLQGLSPSRAQAPRLTLRLQYKGAGGYACCWELGLDPGCTTKIALAEGQNQQRGIYWSQNRKMSAAPRRQSLLESCQIPCFRFILKHTLLLGHFCLLGELLGLLIKDQDTEAPPAQSRAERYEHRAGSNLHSASLGFKRFLGRRTD